MEQLGYVIEIDGAMATVQFKRSKMCANCGACIMIGESDAKVTLKNTLHAEIGDRVRVQLHAKRFLQANLLAYGIPLLTMLLGIALGIQINDTMGAILGLAGAGSGFLILRLLEPRFARMGKFHPRMINIEQPQDA